MNETQAVVKRIRQTLENEPRINLHRYPLKVSVVQGAVVMEGEVADIAAKKLALEMAGAIEGTRGVVDRLCIVPSERRGDGAIRDSLVNFLLNANELRNCTIRVASNGEFEMLREAPPDGSGSIDFDVKNGIVMLSGTVISLSHKRIVGVLAWWTPGCRDVVNSLNVVPQEEDTDYEVIDSVRLVFEMDPFVQPEQIDVKCSNYVVTLQGYVRTDDERRRAELDAWYVFAVDRVINNLELLG
ncbi:BON domain-containing protein [Nitrosomonas sp. Nm166]|uniref:BON domain-containing protein n=1 Tax=Nitrosomonas sp. Nm166 TaxID=1881054 RepID=UPI0008E27F55|nr:BON domain-containing protein [Nitrosomonas sp. Nm166]SFF16988.1 Osmotically-inducible protein OsmY, contains BON domain [Nitrosomonas sp. Nm166]